MRALPLTALLVLAAVAGCTAPSAETTPTPPSSIQTDAASMRALEKTFTGTAAPTPVQEYNQSFALEVPKGATGINATLTWADSTAKLRLALVDPDGKVVQRGFPGSGISSLATVEPPVSGT